MCSLGGNYAREKGRDHRGNLSVDATEKVINAVKGDTKSAGIVIKETVLTFAEGEVLMVWRTRPTVMSTLKLCRPAVGATGGCVRQCEAWGTGRLAARGTQSEIQRPMLR